MLYAGPGSLHSREDAIRLIGNTHGLKASALRSVERLMRRQTRPEQIVSPELARALTEASLDTQRQLGLLIDRRGKVRHAIVGDAKSLFLPDLSAYRRGRDRLCGLRLVHTHLNGEPLTDDDLTDLALLRLDLVAAVDVLGDGLPGAVRVAHLLPNNDDELPWEVEPPVFVHELRADFLSTIDALEEEFARSRAPRAAGDTRERVILAHVGTGSRAAAEDSLAELRELSRSAGIQPAHEIIQRRAPDPRYVLGKGKLQHAVIKAMQLGAEALVFDLNLSPAQIQSVSSMTDLKILDRTQVILDIFAQHAQTREGKIQVELAQLRYMQPRLAAKQTASAFSRLTGGIGGRGPGETKLEIDRRRAQDRIAQLSREVGKLGDRRKMRRGRRQNKGVPVAAVVGYTNAGKSTLLNRLTNSSVTEENALFATLNPVSRRLRFPREREVVLTDTVGFIRHLPEELKDAFRTTFEELEEADLLLHVMDATRPDIEELYQTVRSVLAELRFDDKPVLPVLNKIDTCPPEQVEALLSQYGGVALCALEPATFDPLLKELESALWRPGEMAV